VHHLKKLTKKQESRFHKEEKFIYKSISARSKFLSLSILKLLYNYQVNPLKKSLSIYKVAWQNFTIQSFINLSSKLNFLNAYVQLSFYKWNLPKNKLAIAIKRRNLNWYKGRFVLLSTCVFVGALVL
jgi:hypothetical protein